MKPKPTIDVNAAGIEAQRLFAEDRTASAGLKDMRSAKLARKEQLKSALTIVWEALESGVAVNGYSTKEDWCKRIARCTTRNVQHIIYGRKTSERTTVRTNFLSRLADAKKKLADLQHQRDNPWKGKGEGEKVDFNALYEQTDANPTIASVIEEVLALIAPNGYVIDQNENGKWSVKSEKSIITITPEEQKAKRSAAAKKAGATKAAKKAAAQPVVATPATSLGLCNACGDAPATERIERALGMGDNYCAKCAASDRAYNRKYLRRKMGVQKVMGEFHSFETLANYGGKVGGDGSNGRDPWTMPTMGDYVERLKKNFLGNKSYDQAVVTEYIADMEKKLAKITAANSVPPTQVTLVVTNNCPTDYEEFL